MPSTRAEGQRGACARACGTCRRRAHTQRRVGRWRERGGRERSTSGGLPRGSSSEVCPVGPGTIVREPELATVTASTTARAAMSELVMEPVQWADMVLRAAAATAEAGDGAHTTHKRGECLCVGRMWGALIYGIYHLRSVQRAVGWGRWLHTARFKRCTYTALAHYSVRCSVLRGSPIGSPYLRCFNIKP